MRITSGPESAIRQLEAGVADHSPPSLHGTVSQRMHKIQPLYAYSASRVRLNRPHPTLGEEAGCLDQNRAAVSSGRIWQNAAARERSSTAEWM
jgi:hypothetical protein